MKRYIKSSNEDGLITKEDILRILKEHGIDTTTAKYRLKAQEYERFEDGRRYTKDFTCPGDYLAYFSMFLHRKPDANALRDSYFDTVEEFEDIVNECPTVESIADHASQYWWGDGDDYIILLKNLSNGSILYEGEEEEDYEDDEEDW